MNCSRLEPQLKKPQLFRRNSPPLTCFLLAAGLFGTSIEQAAGQSDSVETENQDLFDLPLEDLLNVEVTTVSRRAEPLSGAPAAIHVISSDAIERSGATTLPDLLRQSPGLHVAQVHAHQWAVSSRGFNDTFANKLLVMVDGRSIYTPLFSGVFWDMQHTVLEDIDRIEVIRGPGASLWGANAVNGVINIITKSAKDTQGTFVSGTAGNYDRFIGTVRHGAQLKENQHYRVYFQHRDHDSFPAADGSSGHDAWQFTQGGFRSDADLSPISVLTFQGDFFSGEFDETFTRVEENPPHDSFPEPGRVNARGGNVLARLTRSLESDADLTVLAYYDANRRDSDIFREDRHTADVDMQHRLPLKNRHLITWGAGYRASADDVENEFEIALTPRSRTIQLFSLFVQDEVELAPDRLALTLGSKFEHNDFTGFEIQPGARLSWTPRNRHTVWGAVARAVRTPSRAEHDIRLNQSTGPNQAEGGPPVLTSIFGSPEYESEELLAYEAGYRVQPLDSVSFDLAMFYNDYDRLRSLERENPRAEPEPAHLPLFASNERSGETYGLELGGNWKASDLWRLHGSYSFLRTHLRQSTNSTDPRNVNETEGSNPKHQWLIRSSVDLPRNWEWDTWFRFVDSLPARGVDSYLEMDMRFSWRPKDNLEFSLVGRNLLDDQHQEFTSSAFVQTQATEIPRSFYAKVAWSF